MHLDGALCALGGRLLGRATAGDKDLAKCSHGPWANSFICEAHSIGNQSSRLESDVVSANYMSNLSVIAQLRDTCQPHP